MDNNTLSITFKGKEILNSSHFSLTSIRLLLLNEFAFNVIIYIWYLLFIVGIIETPNPFFALVISLLQNAILFIYLLIKGISYENLLKYAIILLLFKIMPIYSMMNYMTVSYFDVYSCIYLYIIYIFLLIIILDILLKKNINLMDVFKTDSMNDKYNKNITSNIYDTVYNDMILRII
jgi:hypothetical protein